MLLKLDDSEIRNICKEKLEALEHWLRRLINKTLIDAYGDYFSYEDKHGDRIIKKKIVDSLTNRINKEPNRYPRKVDAILLDDAIDIICHPKLFGEHFKDPLISAFPDGREVARTFMKRLVDPRNRLAHANPISLRQAEQVVCYTGDIIGSIKEYYSRPNMTEEYNVPLILKVIDSFGNSFHRHQFQPVYEGGIIKDLSEDPSFNLRPGDTLTLEVEVDPTFLKADYEIRWTSPKSRTPVSQGRKAVIEITEQQVARQFHIRCDVTTNRSWHRLSNGKDDFLLLVFRVLPPI